MDRNICVDSALLVKMLQSGAKNLEMNVSTVNNLNVFPIPDGDTGDNMLLTITGGVDTDGYDYDNVQVTAREISDGMLLSARGNSGVILSQFFEGFAEGLDAEETADSKQLAKAFKKGAEQAYKAVLEPTEGTMLTVMRCASEYVYGKSYDNLEDLLQEFINEAKSVLEQTPEMLPVLKKAGVVDSGGAGFVYIAEGMLKYLKGEMVVSSELVSKQEKKSDLNLFTENDTLEFGYCTEVLLRLQCSKVNTENFDTGVITEYLKTVGDSIVTIKNDTIVKIHVHTMTPGTVLDFLQGFGEFLKVKIENMSLQHSNTLPKSLKPYGVVAVASGQGVKDLFTERGADVVVDGGQSMNPSTEEFLDAFYQTEAETIFVFPNNSNIILSAKQAADLYSEGDVRVIESSDIGQGYAALSMLNTESGNTDEIVEELNAAMDGVKTLGISRSVRDTDEVKKDDYIGFAGKKILASAPLRYDAICSTIRNASFENYDICILIKGASANQEDTERTERFISDNYPDKEVYVIDGKQKIYDYILILE